MPKMKSIAMSKLRAELRSTIETLGHGGGAIYEIQRHGEPVAVLLSIDDYLDLQDHKSSSSDGTDPDAHLSERMRAVWDQLETSGYRPRSADEVDASLARERASWQQ